MKQPNSSGEETRGQAAERLAKDWLSRHEGYCEFNKPAGCDCKDIALIRQLLAALQRAQAPAPAWQPIETAPKKVKAWYWIVPKSEGETYTDTSGRPILGGAEPHAQVCAYGGWGALYKATHWQPYVIPPPDRICECGVPKSAHRENGCLHYVPASRSHLRRDAAAPPVEGSAEDQR